MLLLSSYCEKDNNGVTKSQSKFQQRPRAPLSWGVEGVKGVEGVVASSILLTEVVYDVRVIFVVVVSPRTNSGETWKHFHAHDVHARAEGLSTEAFLPSCCWKSAITRGSRRPIPPLIVCSYSDEPLRSSFDSTVLHTVDCPTAQPFVSLHL